MFEAKWAHEKLRFRGVFFLGHVGNLLLPSIFRKIKSLLYGSNPIIHRRANSASKPTNMRKPSIYGKSGRLGFDFKIESE
jgi:hypothetical protein